MDYFLKLNKEREIEQDIQVVGDQRCKDDFVKAPLEGVQSNLPIPPSKELMQSRSFFFDEMRVYSLSKGIDLIIQKAPMSLYLLPNGDKATIEARSFRIEEIRKDHHPVAIGRFAALKAIQILNHKSYGLPIKVVSLYAFNFDEHTHYCDSCDNAHQRNHLKIRMGWLTEDQLPQMFKPIVDDYS